MKMLSRVHILFLFFLSFHVYAESVPQPPTPTLVESSAGTYNMSWGSQTCSVGPGGGYTESCDVQSYYATAKQDLSGTCYNSVNDNNCVHVVLKEVQMKGTNGCDPRSAKCTASIPAASLNNYMTPDELQSKGLYLCSVSASLLRGASSAYSKYAFKCLPLTSSPKCSVSDTLFDFGSVSVAEFNGKSLTKDLMVTCTQDANVYITAAQPNISLSNGGQAKLAVEHGADNDSEFIPSSITTGIKATVTLSGDVEPGQFNGSTTIVVNVV